MRWSVAALLMIVMPVYAAPPSYAGSWEAPKLELGYAACKSEGEDQRLCFILQQDKNNIWNMIIKLNKNNGVPILNSKEPVTIFIDNENALQIEPPNAIPHLTPQNFPLDNVELKWTFPGDFAPFIAKFHDAKQIVIKNGQQTLISTSAAGLWGKLPLIIQHSSQ